MECWDIISFAYKSQLLIDSFDVEARHAAFIGNFKEEELFYLKSRGLNRRDCEDLLINGLIIGTLDICFDEKDIGFPKVIVAEKHLKNRNSEAAGCVDSLQV